MTTAVFAERRVGSDDVDGVDDGKIGVSGALYVAAHALKRTHAPRVMRSLMAVMACLL
jgi:hypothetical protein